MEEQVMTDLSARNNNLNLLYLEGKSRQEAMKELGITNTNVMSGASSRLGFHWGWPLENRKSGEAPLKNILPTPRKKTAVNKPVVEALSPPHQSKPSLVYTNPGPQLATNKKLIPPLTDEDMKLGGKRSPFPTPQEESGDPNDLKRAEIHAIVYYLYR